MSSLVRIFYMQAFIIRNGCKKTIVRKEFIIMQSREFSWSEFLSSFNEFLSSKITNVQSVLAISVTGFVGKSSCYLSMRTD